MIENKRSEELALMYKCFVREDSNLGVIIHCLSEYIESLGTQYVEDSNLVADPVAFTQKLLEFKKEIDNMIEQSFHNNIKFEKGRDTSFQNFMNKNASTPASIASYTDRELKQGIQGQSNEEVD